MTGMAVFLLGASSPAYGFPAVEVYKKTSGSVVLIVSSDGRGGSLMGAGSIISAEGHIVTNAHLVISKRTSAPYRKIRVYTKPIEVTGDLSRDLVNRHEARLVAYNTDLDLAVLKVRDLPPGVQTIALADPREIMVGEEVVAIGHPEQGGLWSLTYGRISGQIIGQGGIGGKDVYQTDTSVNRGNSGGPLLDRRGYLVGVNTNIARKGAGGITITGVNFALKSSVVKGWLDRKGVYLAYGTGSLPEEAGSMPAGKEAPAPSPEVKPGPPTEKPSEREPGLKEAGYGSQGETPVDMKTGELELEEERMKELAQQEGERPGSDTILTPKRPYSSDDLFREVEQEMEGLMEEMKRKIRK